MGDVCTFMEGQPVRSEVHEPEYSQCVQCLHLRAFHAILCLSIFRLASPVLLIYGKLASVSVQCVPRMSLRLHKGMCFGNLIVAGEEGESINSREARATASS